MIGESEAPVPRRLLMMLSICIVLGIVGTAAAIINAYASRTASTEDVVRNRALIQRLDRGQQALCAQLNDLAIQARLMPTDCARINR